MADYFGQKSWISNSFLKSVVDSRIPHNIDRIFEFGSLVHAAIFEPYLANTNDVDYELALQMKDTFYRDKLCGNLMKYKGIRPEHEFYKYKEGLKRRCKADTWIKDLDLIVEFKGLSVTNEKGFISSLDQFDYDMGAAFYLDTTAAKRELIVAVSKKKPDKLFRFMVEKGDATYQKGRQKYLKAIIKGLEDGQIHDTHIYDYDLLNESLKSVNNARNTIR